jgi:hypothetical protein
MTSFEIFISLLSVENILAVVLVLTGLVCLLLWLIISIQRNRVHEFFRENGNELDEYRKYLDNLTPEDKAIMGKNEVERIYSHQDVIIKKGMIEYPFPTNLFFTVYENQTLG